MLHAARSIGLLFTLLPLFGICQSWEVFDMGNAGLPSNTIKALVQDQAGIIWAGTDWGLCRFDGSGWTVIQSSEGGLPENDVISLAVDTADRLWVGTALSGIGIFDGVAWEFLNMDNSDLPDNTINGVTHDFRGWTWISTSFGLACISDQGWRIYNNTPESHMGFEFFSPNVRDVIVREDGLVCVSTMNGGLTYLTEEDFIYYTTFNSAFFDNTSNGIVLDASGDRWIASAAAGLIRHAGPYDGGPWFNYSVQNSGFPDNTLTSIVIDAQGMKFAGTELGGVIVFPADGNWTTYDQANSGLPDNRVLSLLIDQDGILWAGTHDGGIARLILPTGTGTHPSNEEGIFVRPTVFERSIEVGSTGGLLDHEWRIFDPSGRSLMQGSVRGTDRAGLDLEALPQGAHILQVSNSCGREAFRIIKLADR